METKDLATSNIERDVIEVVSKFRELVNHKYALLGEFNLRDLEELSSLLLKFQVDVENIIHRDIRRAK